MNWLPPYLEAEYAAQPWWKRALIACFCDDIVYWYNSSRPRFVFYKGIRYWFGP